MFLLLLLLVIMFHISYISNLAVDAGPFKRQPESHVCLAFYMCTVGGAPSKKKKTSKRATKQRQNINYINVRQLCVSGHAYRI